MPIRQPQGTWPRLKGEFADAVVVYLASVTPNGFQKQSSAVSTGTIPTTTSQFGNELAVFSNSNIKATAGTLGLNFTGGMTVLAVGSYRDTGGVQPVENLVNRANASVVGGFTINLYNNFGGTPGRVYSSYYKPAVGDTNWDSAWVNGTKDTTGNGSYNTAVNTRYAVAMNTATGPAASATTEIAIGRELGTSDSSTNVEFVIIWPRKFNEQRMRQITADPYSVFVQREDDLPMGAAGGASATTATPAAGVATVSGVGSFTVPGPAFDWQAFDWQAFDTDIPATATAAAGVATVSGAGSSSSKTTATPAAGAGTVSGTAASGAAGSAGSAAGAATVSAAGASSAKTAATAAAGVATVSAVSQASTAASASAAAGVATVSGVGAASSATTATAAAGIATVSSGVGSSSGAAAATAAAGVATVSASGASSAKTTAAAAAGSATVSAVGTGVIPTTATPAAGAATVSGVGSTSSAGQATATPSSGTSTVSAVGASKAQADASAAGTATVSAAGSALATAAATPADGAATVLATTASNAETVATAAAGVATVSATGTGITAATAIAAAGHATVSGTTPFTGSIDYEAMAAAVWAFVLPNGKTAAETAVETLTLLEALSAAPGCLDVPIEGIFTGGDLLRVIAAVQAGKSTIDSSSPGTATVEFRAIDDSVTRVSADMVGSERADVAINAAD